MKTKHILGMVTGLLACNISLNAQWAGSSSTSGAINRDGDVKIGDNSASATNFLVENGDVNFTYGSNHVSIASPNAEAGMALLKNGSTPRGCAL